MKRTTIVIGLILTLLVTGGISTAQAEIALGDAEGVIGEPQGLTWDPSLAGDVVYSARYGWGGGSGLNFASFGKDIFNIRGEWIVFDESTNNEVGLGLSVDIVKGLRYLGATWIPAAINPQLGVLGAFDLKDKPQGDVCGFLTLIDIPLP